MDASSEYGQNPLQRGFICKDSILSTVSQEEIFQLVFGFMPEECQYVASPLRKDKGPGCWFTYHTSGVLYFIDWGGSRTHSDCFNMVQDYFGLPNFYATLQFIYDKLIKGKPMATVVTHKCPEIITEKPPVKLLVEPRPFNLNDQVFWSKYGIGKMNLVEDKVFAVKKYYALHTKKGDFAREPTSIAYCYTDFQDKRKKLYFPKESGHNRFLSNCSKDDIGGISSLIPYGKQLIITKGYKDYRVLKNHGKNVVWFQNEGMIPNDEALSYLVQHFKSVIVWYDNDHVGIQASERVRDKINSLFPAKARNLWLPERLHDEGIKDPSDCIAQDSPFFIKFLNTFT
jgi:hypothetical protein